LSVDTDWLARYEHRTQHPPDDAEKVIVQNGRVTRIHRGIASPDAHGEFTGLAKFTGAGAAELRDHYYRARGKNAGPRKNRAADSCLRCAPPLALTPRRV